MNLKERLRRLNYVANVVRTENEDIRMNALLGELDSELSDIRAELFGIDELEENK